MKQDKRIKDHDNIVTQMINLSDTKGNFILHGDTIPERIEESYKYLTGYQIDANHVSGGIIYTVGKAKIVYGKGMRNHPMFHKVPVLHDF